MKRWIAFALGVVTASAIWLGLPANSNKDTDLVTYSIVVGDMRVGYGYYAAMADGLDRTVGPASTIRAYRLPTVFVVWRIPGFFSWAATFVVLVISGVLVAIATDPVVGLAILLWLAAVAHPVGAEQWHSSNSGLFHS
jgi:hypothetical protein